MRTGLLTLALATSALLAGCAATSQLKPSDGSSGPIAVSFSNPDDPPKADGSKGDYWAFRVEAEGSVTPAKKKVDGVLDSIRITAHPRSRSSQFLSAYNVCLVYELDSGRWKSWQCSGRRVVNKLLESGSSFAADDVRFSIPASRPLPPAHFWLVIRVYSPTQDGRESYVYSHSQRKILSPRNAGQ